MQNSSEMIFDLTGTMDVGKSLELNTQGATGGMDFNMDGGTMDIDQHLILMANAGASGDSLIINMQYVGARLEIYDSVKLDSSGGTIQANGSNSTVAYDGPDQTIVVDTNISYLFTQVQERKLFKEIYYHQYFRNVTVKVITLIQVG